MRFRGQADGGPLRTLLEAQTATVLLEGAELGLFAADGELVAGAAEWPAGVADSVVALAAGRPAPAPGGVELVAIRPGHRERIVGAVVAPVGSGADASAVARRIGAVVAALEAVEERGRALLDRSRESNLFYLLGEAIGSVLDVRRIADLLTTEARRIGHGEAALMLLEAEGAQGLTVRARDGDAAVCDALSRHVPERLECLDGSSWSGAQLPGGPTPDLGPVLTVGVHSGDVVLGLLAVGRAPGAAPFTDRDERVLAALASGAGIEKARYHERELHRQRLEQELALGRRIQLSLLPTSLPAIPGWEVHVVYRAAREVGGDFYDVAIPGGDDGAGAGIGGPDDPGLVVTVGDVTGKGVPAALMMAHARSVLRSAGLATADPREALEAANRVLRSDNRSGLFLSALSAAVDTATGRVRAASAGHEPASILHADGRVEELAGGGTMLAMTRVPEIVVAEVELGPWDALVLHTDGVTDARDPHGDFFGEVRLRAALAGAAGADAAGIGAAVVDAVDAHRGGADAYDDLTLLVLRRTA